MVLKINVKNFIEWPILFEIRRFSRPNAYSFGCINAVKFHSFLLRASGGVTLVLERHPAGLFACSMLRIATAAIPARIRELARGVGHFNPEAIGLAHFRWR